MGHVRPLAVAVLVGALSLAAWGQGVGYQRQVQPIAAREVFEFGPSWSALDTIVFFAGTPPVVSDPQLDLVTVDGDGNHRRQLTQTPGRDWQPWFSSDGRTIYFSSEREGNPEIYALDALDARPVALTHGPGRDWLPAWNPNGDHVLEDEEVARAIALWAQGQNLEGVGRALSDELIVRLVDLWVRGSALDEVL